MHYYSSGKLLITGEYLVLKGARALVSPVKFGQSLNIAGAENDGWLTWESFENEICWFKAKFDTTFLKIIDTTDHKIADRLLSWLKAADQLNPGFLALQKSKNVFVKADFKLSWGLGSSSSLLSDIAFWAGIDPFKLHLLVSKGSGYDVVFAREHQPGFFSRTDEYYKVESADFNPSFKGCLFFIYLGNKQDSSASVNAFNARTGSLDIEIKIISDLSERIAFANTLSSFEECISHHEEIISHLLGKERLKKDRFSDLRGEIKSLGAWGGDFAMITWHDTAEELKKYLKTKNIDIVFSFDEMIKTK